MTQRPVSINLYRIDPDQNMARFYALSIQPNLFGGSSLVRNWGRIGSSRQLKIDMYKDVVEASRAFDHLASIKKRRGYRSMPLC